MFYVTPLDSSCTIMLGYRGSPIQSLDDWSRAASLSPQTRSRSQTPQFTRTRSYRPQSLKKPETGNHDSNPQTRRNLGNPRELPFASMPYASLARARLQGSQCIFRSRSRLQKLLGRYTATTPSPVIKSRRYPGGEYHDLTGCFSKSRASVLAAQRPLT